MRRQTKKACNSFEHFETFHVYAFYPTEEKKTGRLAKKSREGQGGLRSRGGGPEALRRKQEEKE